MTKFLLHLKKPLFTLLVWGFIIRIMILFFAYSWDVNSHITWGKELIERGIQGFYDRPTIDHFSTIYPNYPPLSIYLFSLFYGLYSLCKHVLWQMNILFPVFPSFIVTWFDTREVIAAFMKIPSILADIGISYMLYLIVLRYKNEKLSALYAVVFFLFNPVFWYTSALWGQIESIAIFFILISFYLLLYSDRKIASIIMLIFALLTKQTSIVFLPVFFIFYLKKYSLVSSIISSFVALIVFWLAFIPFYQQGNILLFPFSIYIQRILSVSGIPFASNHAFNYWALITQWKDVADTIYGWGMQYRYWGYLIVFTLSIFIFFRSIQRSLSSKNMFFTALIFAFTVYLFFTRIHERHLQQSLVFFIPFVIFDKKMKIAYYIISFIHFINLYHNWSVVRNELLIQVILSPITVNILILVLLVTYFYIFSVFVRNNGWLQKQNEV